MSCLCVDRGGRGNVFICGFACKWLIGGPAHIVRLGGKDWNWLAAQPAFFALRDERSPASLAVWMQMLSVVLAALIPMVGGRAVGLGVHVPLRRHCCGITYPLFAHWVWGGAGCAIGVNLRLGTWLWWMQAGRPPYRWSAD